MLHSAARSRIDYTVREQESSSTESLLKHYLGIYDQETQQLQLIEAREATIRGTPRMDTGDDSVEEKNDTAPNVNVFNLSLQLRMQAIILLI